MLWSVVVVVKVDVVGAVVCVVVDVALLPQWRELLRPSQSGAASASKAPQSLVSLRLASLSWSPKSPVSLRRASLSWLRKSLVPLAPPCGLTSRWCKGPPRRWCRCGLLRFRGFPSRWCRCDLLRLPSLPRLTRLPHGGSCCGRRGLTRLLHHWSCCGLLSFPRLLQRWSRCALLRDRLPAKLAGSNLLKCEYEWYWTQKARELSP